jgi:hypothetical protein
LSREISFFLGERGKNFYFAHRKYALETFSFLRRREWRLFKEERIREFERVRVQMGAITSRRVGDDDENFCQDVSSEFIARASAGVSFDEQKKSRCLNDLSQKRKKKTLLSLLSFFFPSPLFLPSLGSGR